MMIIDIKYWMQTNLPILTYINPVSLITDGLYALYYYDNLSRYTFLQYDLLICNRSSSNLRITILYKVGSNMTVFKKYLKN